MYIKLDQESLRTALQALRTLYAGDDDVYYSVENGKMIIESVGGMHRFCIDFAVSGTDTLAMQKTTIGTLTQLLSMLGEYSDLLLTEVAIMDDPNTTAYVLKVSKQLKIGSGDPVDCLSLSKTMLVTMLTETEKENVLKSRAAYTGNMLFECPAAISLAATKAHILKAEALHVRGKDVYCASGDGICRVKVPELADDLVQTIDADFVYSLVKLGADKYDFYADHVECVVGDVTFKLGIPRKAEEKNISADIMALFEKISSDDVRVYCKEVRSIYGNGPLRIMPNKTMLLDNKITVGAPYVLPLKDTIFQIQDSGMSTKQLAVTVSYAIAQAAGDSWTVGVAAVKDKTVAKVSGECDILFNAYS